MPDSVEDRKTPHVEKTGIFKKELIVSALVGDSTINMLIFFTSQKASY